MISVKPVRPNARKALAKIRQPSKPSTGSSKGIDHEVSATLTVGTVPPLENFLARLETYGLHWPASQTDVIEPMPGRGPTWSARCLWFFSFSWPAHNQIGCLQYSHLRPFHPRAPQDGQFVPWLWRKASTVAVPADRGIPILPLPDVSQTMLSSSLDSSTRKLLILYLVFQALLEIANDIKLLEVAKEEEG